jgi:hypothetical protein
VTTSRCSRHASRPRSGVSSHASDAHRLMDAMFFVLHPGCQGHALYDTSICAAVRPIAASKSGQWPPSAWPAASSPGRALTESGLRWTGRYPRPRWGETVGKHPTERGQIGTKRASSPTAACRAASPWWARIVMPARWRGRPSSVSPRSGKTRQQAILRGGGWTKAMIMTKSATGWPRLGASPTSRHGEKRPRRSSRKPLPGLAVGGGAYV